MYALARLTNHLAPAGSLDASTLAPQGAPENPADLAVRAARGGRDPHAFAVLLLGAPDGTTARVRVVTQDDAAGAAPVVEREVVIPTTPTPASYGVPASRMFTMPARGVALAVDLPSGRRVNVPWGAITPGGDRTTLDDAGVVDLARLTPSAELATASSPGFLAKHGKHLAVGGAVALAVAAVVALSSSGGARANPSCGADCTCAACRKRHGAKRKGG